MVVGTEVQAQRDRAGGALESRRRLSGHAALVCVQLCFGLFPIFGKWAFGSFSPLSVACWRITFAAATLGALALAVHGTRVLLPRADLARLALGSLLGITVNMVFYLEGLSRSTATNAGLIIGLIPVFTFGIAALVRQEPFLAPRALGLAVALTGASMLFWAERPELVRAYGFGNFLMAINALSYAGFLVLTKPLTRVHPPLVVIAWVFVWAVPFVPLLNWMAARGDLVTALAVWFPPQASADEWLSMGFILVFPTCAAYLLNVFALSRLRASTTAVYIYLQTLITAFASALLLRERPTGGTVASAACIFAGIWLVSRPLRRRS